ncbi:hyaluronidase-like [Cylas formicarius]|uniref:hyaluronidase-like n=1 Tax=Cylas formicarius TaxID=197179 RepID=UPI0029586F4C|nr:hyaluronidase-like [Cylas formicarius]
MVSIGGRRRKNRAKSAHRYVPTLKKNSRKMGFIHKCILCLLLYKWQDKINHYETKLQRKGFKVYWNSPTFQCDSHKQNFSQLLEKYGIVQNANARFRGDNITILYDPGSFPAILKDAGDRLFLRNGGIPQQGNLTLHLNLLNEIVEQLIPNTFFSGIAVIDFESWRPVFRQNFGTLLPYQEISIGEERKNYPSWPIAWLKKEAGRRFEEAGRTFMTETLRSAKRLRPNATWGYYAYPYCFNMSPSNMKRACAKEAQQENDRTTWLFNLADNFYPSLYLGDKRLNATDKIQLVQGRLDEALRLRKALNAPSKQILPYFWYKYQDTLEFLRKDDLLNTLTVLAGSNVDGVILWGSSNDVNTKAKCQQLYAYLDDILGPLIQRI